MRRTGVPLGILTNGRQLRRRPRRPGLRRVGRVGRRDLVRRERGPRVAPRAARAGRRERRRRARRDRDGSRRRSGPRATARATSPRSSASRCAGPSSCWSARSTHELAARRRASRRALDRPAHRASTLDDDEAHAAIFQAATRVVMRLVLDPLRRVARPPARATSRRTTSRTASRGSTACSPRRTATAPKAPPRRRRGHGSSASSGSSTTAARTPISPCAPTGASCSVPASRASPEPVLRALAAFEQRQALPTRPSTGSCVSSRSGEGQGARRPRRRAGSPGRSTSRTCAPSTSASSTRACSTTSCAARPPTTRSSSSTSAASPRCPLSRLERADARPSARSCSRRSRRTRRRDVETEARRGARGRRRSRRRGGATSRLGRSGGRARRRARRRGRRGRDRASSTAGRGRRSSTRAGSASREARAPTSAELEPRASTARRGSSSPASSRRAGCTSSPRAGCGRDRARSTRAPRSAVPLVQRTLEPLCYERDGDSLVPRTARGDPRAQGLRAGDGLGLVPRRRASLPRRRARRVASSTTGGSSRRSERETIVTLPFGVGGDGRGERGGLRLCRPRTSASSTASGRGSPATSSSAASTASTSTRWRSSSRGSRSGSRRSIASCRSSTSTTSSRPATRLVGCWLHLVDDYPLRALDREGGDGSKGERTKWLKAKLAAGEAGDARRDPGAGRRDDALRRARAPGRGRRRAGARAVRAAPRPAAGAPRGRLPRAARERGVPRLKERMDLWCALWFWPPGDDALPTPRTWAELDDEASATLGRRRRRAALLPLGDRVPRRLRPGAQASTPCSATRHGRPCKPNSKFFSRARPALPHATARPRRSTFSGGCSLRSPGSKSAGRSTSADSGRSRTVVKAFADPFEVSLGRGREGCADLAAAWARSVRTATEPRRPRPALPPPGHGQASTRTSYSSRSRITSA